MGDEGSMDIVTVNFDFAYQGEILEPRAGVVAVDVGSTCVAGVIDHHFAEAGDECAATLVASRGEELVLRHLKDAPSGDLVIVVHREPDLDALVAAYLTAALAQEGRIPDGGCALAEYARALDAGRLPPDGLGPTSLFGLYSAACHLSESQTELVSDETELELYVRWLERGFALLDIAIENRPGRVDEVALPEELRGWEEEQAFLNDEQERYATDRESAELVELELPTIDGEGTLELPGLRVRSPRSALFRQFAQAEGFPFIHEILERRATTVDDEIAPERHVIMVAPESGVWLRGLGAALERREVEARGSRGGIRPQPARWPDVTNSDPWYDGRSPIHGYSVVDTPYGGTVLSIEEVIEVTTETTTWIALGRPSPDLICSKGCRLPADSGASYCPYHADKLMPTLVDGRWDVEELIAQGGMGSVWLVRDVRTSKRYAMKRLLQRFMGNEEVWARFRREAVLASRLAHPNIVRLVASGTSAEAGPYFVTEYVEGIDLRQDLATFQLQREWYPWPRARAVLHQVCQALQAVHRAGVLHRDLKPENIMLVAETAGDDNPWPPVKVLDFGLSILSDPSAPRLTAEGAISGTAEYAAPEQMGGMDLDERTDLYTVGAILYELLSYEPPFGELVTPAELGLAKVTREAPALPNHHPQLEKDPLIEELLYKLLAREPSARPPDAAAVLEALSDIPA